MELITAAIVGALSKLAQPAINDAYNIFKGLLLNRLAENKRPGKANVEEAISQLEKNPNSDARKAVLNEEIIATRSHDDVELTEAARNLLRELGSLPGSGAYVQNVSGDRNIFSQSGPVHINDKK
jgi:hypothetical protein